jgi:putative restriction endonuclease
MGMIDDELQRRLNLWDELRNHDTSQLEAQLIRDLGIYSGAAGVYCNFNETRKIVPETGLVVSIMHTGRHYTDVMNDNELIYDFPKTARPEKSDLNEIAALESCFLLKMPLFVISHTTSGKRKVTLGRITGFNRDASCCIVQLDYFEIPRIPEAVPATIFEPIINRKVDEVTAKRIDRDPLFKFNALARYHGKCVISDISVQRMLDGAHVVPVQKSGTDDVRNSLLLSASLHRAYDGNLWCVEPESLMIFVKKSGPNAKEMKLERLNLKHLDNPPDSKALEIRWELFLDATNKQVEVAG